MSMDYHILETLHAILCHLRGEAVPRYHVVMRDRDGKPIRNQDERDEMRAIVEADLEEAEKYRCKPGEPAPSCSHLFDEQRMLDTGIFYNPNEDMLL